MLSGDDFTTLPLLCVGGMGVISVVSNVVPGDMAGMCNAFFKGDLAKARELHYKMWPLTEAMFYRDQPRPGQDRPETDGQDHRRGAAAAVPHVRRPTKTSCAR